MSRATITVSPVVSRRAFGAALSATLALAAVNVRKGAAVSAVLLANATIAAVRAVGKVTAGALSGRATVAALAVKTAFTSAAIQASVFVNGARSRRVTSDGNQRTVASGAVRVLHTFAAPAKGQVIAPALRSNSTLAVARRAVSSQRITSSGDRRVLSAGDVRVVHQYS